MVPSSDRWEQCVLHLQESQSYVRTILIGTLLLILGLNTRDFFGGAAAFFPAFCRAGVTNKNEGRGGAGCLVEEVGN